MSPQIAVKSYRRAFRRPLRTAHGGWATREGFLLRVEQDGQIGYGEVAPIPDFGSETIEAAAEFLQRLTRDPQLEVPAGLPCCAFALSAARSQLDSQPREYSVSALLPAGSAAQRLAWDKIDLGYRNLKWKIGVEPIAKELVTSRGLLEKLPSEVKVRFDANAALNRDDLERWLELFAEFPDAVDYLEQALPCGEEAVMAEYMQSSGVPFALDESLNAAGGVSFLAAGAWAGPLVVKAPLLGDIARLLDLLSPVAAQVVLSSVFETGIGLENALTLADALPEIQRPIGFDTVAAFDDDLLQSHRRPRPASILRHRSSELLHCRSNDMGFDLAVTSQRDWIVGISGAGLLGEGVQE